MTPGQIRHLAALAVAVLASPALAGGEEALAREVDAYLATATGPEPAGKSGYEDVPEFGGPSSTPTQMKLDDLRKEPTFRLAAFDQAVKPWFDWKAKVKEKIGLAFSLNYTALTQWASESMGASHGASGIFEFLGTWTFYGKESGNTGSLVFKVEHRHRLGADVTPFDLGFVAGSILPTAVKFNDFGWGVTNLYWQQRLLKGRVAFVIGVLDPTDFLDIHAAINPLTSFTNFQFSTNPTIPVPNQGLGAAVGAMVSDHIYLIASLSDANAVPTRAGFDTFFDDREYFTSLEIGWTTSFERRFFDKVDVMLWHQDARSEAAVPEGWGAVATASWFFQDKFLPFVRMGWNDGGGGALLRATAAAGIGIHVATRGLVGAGVGWGEPQDRSLRDQYTFEFFYRLQLAQSLALTPDIQVVLDPALDPSEDVLVFFSLRLRVTF